MTISDGSLPSNVGGGGNVRNILRRVFSIMQKNGWYDKLPMNEFMEIFNKHKEDLFGIYGEFPKFESFNDIIMQEYERWRTTDDA
jgi:alanyl-tRNA synthetase